MDPLHYCIMVTPLAVYLCYIGMLNLKSRPFITTGARDTAGLGIGLAGYMISGPIMLFFPESAASHFGGWVWLMLIVFYGLLVSLLVLMMRPRLVIYNMTSEQLRPILTSVARKLDPKSRWAGNSLLIPAKNIHLHLEPVNWLKNIQLTSGGNQQSFDGWRELEAALEEELKEYVSTASLFGFPLLIVAASLAVTALIWMVADREAVATAWEELRRY